MKRGLIAVTVVAVTFLLFEAVAPPSALAQSSKTKVSDFSVISVPKGKTVRTELEAPTV